jgi:hypothetical protein
MRAIPIADSDDQRRGSIPWIEWTKVVETHQFLGVADPIRPATVVSLVPQQFGLNCRQRNPPTPDAFKHALKVDEQPHAQRPCSQLPSPTTFFRHRSTQICTDR